jgi:hypothetical protein
MMMQDVEGSTCDLVKEADRVIQELDSEARANCETTAQDQPVQIMHLAGETFEALDEGRWSLQDCLEYQADLRAYRKIANKVNS